MIDFEGLLEAPFRNATDGDLEQILPLAKYTVPGFVECLWRRLAGENETADDFGFRAQGAFVAERNTIVADFDGRLGAMLISYPMAETPNPHVPGMDEMIKPLVRLFYKAKGTWYLHGIATYPEYSGRGLASRLMEVAEKLGKSAGKPRISLVVIDTNLHAITFYEKRGYSKTASEPIVRKGWETKAKEWILMEKSLS